MITSAISLVRPLLLSTIRCFGQKLQKVQQAISPQVRKKQKIIDRVSLEDGYKTEPSIVIIGAGIAGLSVAQRLAQCGLNNFVVLEATERPGGRIHSLWLGDVVAEMGCQWTHGAPLGNSEYTSKAEEGYLNGPLENTDWPTGLNFSSNFKTMDHATSMMAYHIFEEIKSEAEKFSGIEQSSLINFVNLRIQHELLKYPENQRYDMSKILHNLTQGLRFLTEESQNVSADKYRSLINIPGTNAKMPLGFVGVLSPLLHDLPEESVKFGKPVSLIRWGAVQSRRKGPRAVVQCNDGEEYYADYVVLTVSLGVLKEHGDKMFCPALPGTKMEAINALGFGNVDKVFLDYSKPFWVWSEGGIKIQWSPEELKDRTGWTKGLVSIEEVEGSKHVLCAFICGPEAVVMEHTTDEEVAEGITRILRQHTGDQSVPFPTKILRSKWASDPFFCGSFSYMNPTANMGHQSLLSSPVPGSCDPVPPILLFAGEATCAGHHSTVHGARLSGIREAERIVQLTKKFGGPPPKL